MLRYPSYHSYFCIAKQPHGKHKLGDRINLEIGDRVIVYTVYKIRTTYKIETTTADDVFVRDEENPSIASNLAARANIKAQ